MLAAAQSETAAPPKTDFEAWAPKLADNARQNASVDRLFNSAPARIPLPQASRKRRQIHPRGVTLIYNINHLSRRAENAGRDRRRRRAVNCVFER
jgi:hypothetical protein